MRFTRWAEGYFSIRFIFDNNIYIYIVFFWFFFVCVCVMAWGILHDEEKRREEAYFRQIGKAYGIPFSSSSRLGSLNT